MTQQIRTSQFVTTYGPGAILEGQNGPRIIPLPNIGLFQHGAGIRPDDFSLEDARMGHALQVMVGGRPRIFRLPSNAELGLTEIEVAYNTISFPDWRLCSNMQGHGQPSYVLYIRGPCPVCRSDARETQEPIRFVLACSNGHLDDVNWYELVHQGRSTGCRQTNWFRWFGGGGALSEISLECPRCRERVSLGHAYSQSWTCSGRFPENGPLRGLPISYGGCDRDARITQRQASNLRIPELMTLFTIPPRDTILHDLLHYPPIRSILLDRRGNIPTLDDFRNILTTLVNNQLVSRDREASILSFDWTRIREAIQVVITTIPPTTQYHDLVREEFRALVEASVNGAHADYFEVNPNRVRRVAGPNGRILRIVPVDKLRTVTVQIGYRREVDRQIGSGNPAAIVRVGFPDRLDHEVSWYPGVQFLGEGVFVMLDEGWHFNLEGSSAQMWQTALGSYAGYPSHAFRGGVNGGAPDELHPVFTWWHSFSHALIRSTSIRSGYSVASVRERVYIDTEGQRVTGGMLLYATQPGSQGALGGMIALVPHFEDILNEAFENLQTCSGDPLCEHNRFEPGKYNGAACYACLLVSETSCEHRNMWLDRNVISDNIP